MVILVIFLIVIIVVEPHKTDVAFLSTNLARHTLLMACCSISALGYIFHRKEMFFFLTIIFGFLPVLCYYTGWILRFLDTYTRFSSYL